MLLDNEVSEEHFKISKDHGLAAQLASLGNHMQNLSERAIQTHKNNLIAVISGTDPSLPMML